MANEVFVGRRDEQERFAALLRGLAARSGEQKRRWRARRPAGDIEAVTAGSRVALVHGLGGSGKSSLLRQFRAIAEGSLPGSSVVVGGVRTAWLDWEDEAGQDPGRYAGVAGPSLVTVLDAVQRTVTGAFTGDGGAAGRVVEAFGDYRRGAAQMPEYVARFRGVVAQAGRQGSAFTSQDAAALVRIAVSAGLVAGGHPGGMLGLGPDQVAETIQAGGHLSEAAAEAVTGRKRGEISAQEYDLVTDPARELARRVAAAVRGAADSKPLVVFLDTGEVIGDRAWGWLRRVMTRTGPRVAWVVGARFETEAEAGVDSPVARFVREIGDEHLMLMSPARFDDAMIRAYLESRPGGRSFTALQIDLIARFTRGLPLAVSFTATLLDGGLRVEEACRDIDEGHPSTVISSLARRYLVHAETREAQDAYPPGDPRRGDVTKILALALAYGNVRDDPDLLAALWDTGDPLATFQGLARHHDFVLPTSRRLHDDVRDTLRTDLLDPYRRLRARSVNERALTLFTTRLAHMRGRWPTLDHQLGQAEFTTALLGALWHTTWIGNQDGLDLLIAVLPVLAAADPRTADAAAAITGQFTGTYTPDQERQLDQLTQRRPGLFDFDDLPNDLRPRRRRTTIRRAQITLDGLALHPRGSAETEPPLGQPGDRTAAVYILRARLQVADHQDEAAVGSLQTVAADTTSTRLRQAIGTQALEIACRLIWAGPQRTAVRTKIGLAAAKIASEMLPSRGAAWQSYGVALRQADRAEEALFAYDQALGLDFSDSSAHTCRGNALGDLGRFEDALTAHDRAIELDPDNSFVHVNRGNALGDLGRFEDALTAHDRAIELDPDNSFAHDGRGDALRALGRFEDALTAHDRAIAAAPDNCYAHDGRGVALQDLGRFEDALTAHDGAIALDPNYSFAHTNLGNALQALGRFEDALTAYDRAIALNPNMPGRHENKGIVLAVTGHLDRALAEFDTSDRLDPIRSGAGRAWAGAILWHRRDATAARDRFAHVRGRVRGCTPFHTAALEAIALCGLGQPDSAEQHLLSAVSQRAIGDRAEPRKIYELLTDPPLPGIDRLRAIIDNGSI